MADERPADWDWVTAKHECSPVAMFETLKRLAQRDVNRRNEQLGTVRLNFSEINGIEFSVSRDAHMDGRVYFQVSDNLTQIHVRRHPDDGILYTVHLNNEGKCKFRREGTNEDVDAWQVLQAALDPMLFTP